MNIQEWIATYPIRHREFQVVWVNWDEERIYCRMGDDSVWWTHDGETFYWSESEVYDLQWSHFGRIGEEEDR